MPCVAATIASAPLCMLHVACALCGAASGVSGEAWENKQEPAVAESALYDILRPRCAAEEPRAARCEACTRPVPHTRQQLSGTRRDSGGARWSAEDGLWRARTEHVVGEPLALCKTLLCNGLGVPCLLNDAPVVLGPFVVVIIFILFFLLRIQSPAQLLGTRKVRRGLAPQDGRGVFCAARDVMVVQDAQGRRGKKKRRETATDGAGR